jgi:acyl-CoA synthetase (AMP-forming)/AMP-acid ligase II/lauroyl/myristoyl acyltransferase/acyl carrier protein
MTSNQHPPHFSNLVELLQWRARERPDALALAYLDDELNICASLTYRQLERKARCIGAHLSEQLSPSERVLLVYPENIAFLPAFLGCLYAGLIAVPVIFPDPNRLPRLLPRIQKIIEDSQSRLVLSLEKATASLGVFFGDGLVATDTLPEDRIDGWQHLPITPHQLTHLQYTSGSISIPKGVMITHANILHNLEEEGKFSLYSEQSKVLNWMPHTHDFGLMSGLLQPIFYGVPVFTLSPVTIARQPIRWLQAITKYRITHSNGVPFALDYCVNRTTSVQREGLDLSCWRMATVGAEPIRPETLERFIETFSPYGFHPATLYPAFGLAEYTLVVTKKPLGQDIYTTWLDLGGNQLSRLTGCGCPIGGTRVEIVDPDTHQPCPPGRIGEVWVSGLSMSPGYWNQPELNREIFQAQLKPSGDGPFLRTGDLGLFQDGELFVTGRLKDMFIIHGQNYYPYDIEWMLQDCHPALAGCRGAAFAIEVDGQEKPVVVHETNPPVEHPHNFEQVVEVMRGTLAERFEMTLQAVVLIKRGDLPRTSSGKIRRPATRQAYLENRLNPLHQWRLDDLSPSEISPETDPLLISLKQIWAETLNIRGFSSNQNFFALGGDSLSALQMVLSVEQKIGKRVPMAFFITPTIENLVVLLRDDTLFRDKTASESGLLLFKALPQKHSFGLQHPAMFSWFYTLYNRVLKTLCGQKWFQVWIFPKMTRLMQRFHQTFNTSMDLPYFTQLALFSSLTRKKMMHWLQNHIPLVTLLQSGQVHGEKFLRQGLQTGRGVILIVHHSHLIDLVPPVVDNMGIKDLHILRRNPYVNRKIQSQGLKRLSPRIDLYIFHRKLNRIRKSRSRALRNPSLRIREDELVSLTQKALHALEILSRGGVVIIAGDGQAGTSQSTQVNFHGRTLNFFKGFAELGLKSGASIVPVMMWFTPTGSPVITFQSPLEVKTSLTPAETVDDLLEQYTDRLARCWADYPWSILPIRMNWFIQASTAGKIACK